MNSSKFQSLNDIRKELKILRLKKDISYEMIKENKEDLQEVMEPLNLVNKILGPLKKIIIVYLFKKVFK